jgi:hypothetical protein
MDDDFWQKLFVKEGRTLAKEYVPIFFEWLDVTQDLSAEEKGNLIDAVVSYASGREYEHLLNGAPCRIAFRFLKGQVDRNAAISDVRRQARQGKTQQTITNDNKTQQTESNFPKEKEKEKEKENKKDKEKETEPQKRFTPPTVEDVKNYCRERGNKVDAERFVDFYSSKGWRVGNQPMRDWKAAVRTWEKRDETPAAVVPKKTVTAQQYSQRPYDFEHDDALTRMFEQMDAANA